MNPARYIALEGTEGVGKTTLARHLKKRLTRKGVKVVMVREPGGTPVGESIRDILLHGDHLAAWTEALLFAAARSELMERVVRPSLAEGSWVVADRCFFSSLAYQGHADGLGLDPIWAVNSPAVTPTIPDLVVWHETDPEVGLGRQAETDRIGGRDLAVHQRVWEGYRRLWVGSGGQMLRVDAAAPPDQTAQLLMSVCEERRWLDSR